jgi:hypothetical protein
VLCVRGADTQVLAKEWEQDSRSSVARTCAEDERVVVTLGVPLQTAKSPDVLFELDYALHGARMQLNG